MTDNPREGDEAGRNYAEPVPEEARRRARTGARNGHQTNGQHANGRRANAKPLPGLNVRELWHERNWTALAGLGLMALGVLFVVQLVLDLELDLAGLMLLGAGGWLAYDGWQSYTGHQRSWTGSARQRLNAGVLLAALGVMLLVDINWAGVLMAGAGGWLAYDGWQRYEAAGRHWHDPARTRAIAGGVIGAVGLLMVLDLGSPVPLVLILVGGYLLYRQLNQR